MDAEGSVSRLKFRVGDIVTRDGTDRQRIIEINDAGDLIHVECIRAPLGWLNDDGSRGASWCEIGDREWNIPWRYDYPEETMIDHTPLSGELRR